MTRVMDELVEAALRELADEDEQRQLWLAAEGPRISSFTECISQLWDDSGLSDALDGQSGAVYTSEIDERLRKLRDVLRNIDGNRAPEEILRDPPLDEGRAVAQRLLMDLRYFGLNDGK